MKGWERAPGSGLGGPLSCCCLYPLFWEMYCRPFSRWRTPEYKCAPAAVFKICFPLFFTVTQGKSMHLETRVVFFRCSSYIFTSSVQFSSASSSLAKNLWGGNGEESSWIIYLELGLHINMPKGNVTSKNSEWCERIEMQSSMAVRFPIAKTGSVMHRDNEHLNSGRFIPKLHLAGACKVFCVLRKGWRESQLTEYQLVLLTVHSLNNSLLSAYLKQLVHQVECDLVPVHKEFKLHNSIQLL